MKLRTSLPDVPLAAVSFTGGALWARGEPRTELKTRIFSANDARTSKGSWRAIRIFTEGGTPTCGAGSLLTGALEFLARQTISATA